MNNNQQIQLLLAPIDSELLDIVANADEFTQSDLQGAIEVQVSKAFNLGYKQANNNAMANFNKIINSLPEFNLAQKANLSFLFSDLLKNNNN